jgi:hypothetical protein
MHKHIWGSTWHDTVKDDTIVVKGCSLSPRHEPTDLLPLGGWLPNTLCSLECKLLTSERLRDCGEVAAA